jgi:hypothetical protein
MLTVVAQAVVSATQNRAAQAASHFNLRVFIKSLLDRKLRRAAPATIAPSSLTQNTPEWSRRIGSKPLRTMSCARWAARCCLQRPGVRCIRRDNLPDEWHSGAKLNAGYQGTAQGLVALGSVARRHLTGHAVHVTSGAMSSCRRVLAAFCRSRRLGQEPAPWWVSPDGSRQQRAEQRRVFWSTGPRRADARATSRRATVDRVLKFFGLRATQ